VRQKETNGVNRRYVAISRMLLAQNELQKAIAARGLRQAKVTQVPRVTQPHVSDLLRGRIDTLSARTP
jgi:predicted XRE-type DNA-binding protein